MRIPTSPAELPRQAHQDALHTVKNSMLLFNAATGYDFTVVLAGLALTTTSLPKITLFPALVAGFWRVLIWQTPGMMNLPALFTSLVAIAARLPMTWEQTDFFKSYSVASAAAM